MSDLKYCYDREPVADFGALCAKFGGKALQSPFRSTVPLLTLVMHDPNRWAELLDALGVGDGETVHFEYCVASANGKGNPSQTDAMVFSGTTACAIEAKWTEPHYTSVAKRLRQPEAHGGDPRVTINGWLSHLSSAAPVPIELDAIQDIAYQVLHRAASACAAAAETGRAPVLAYLHFHPSPSTSAAPAKQYRDDLQTLCSAMGPKSRLRAAVVEVPLKPTQAFSAIEDLNKHAQESAVRVSQALQAAPLFTFGEPVITWV